MHRLVADVGGTNSRFALCRAGEITLIEPRKYPNEGFPELADAMAHYIAEVGIAPQEACLAVAGPAHGDAIALTNIDWKFSVEDYRQRFGLSRLQMTNDFTALAMSVPYLEPQNIRKVGGGQAIADMPISVLGPGTGLGVSGLLRHQGRWVPIQGEGGNVDFTPGNEEEIELLRLAWKERGHVRAEDFISGTGMRYLHALRQEIAGKKRVEMDAADIVWRAKMEDCGTCRETVNMFCGMLGSFAGSQALSLGAFGGVYIGGGVAPQLEELFDQSPFRERFEAKGRFSDYVRGIPTFIMLSHSRNALVGAAAMLG